METCDNMNEIKFRYIIKIINSKYYKKGEVHVRYYTLDDIESGQPYNQEYDEHEIEVIARDRYSTVKTEKGQEIYENDIVVVDTTDLQTKRLHTRFTAVVKFSYGFFHVEETIFTPVYNIHDFHDHITIIGNTHQNPEIVDELRGEI